MGSPVFAVVANLYMEFFEEKKALTSVLSSLLFTGSSRHYGGCFLHLGAVTMQG